MNRFFKLLVIAVLMILPGGYMAAQNNPVADPEAVVVSGDMRFTVLTPEMIRIEWRSSSDKAFVDDATFTVLNRRLPVPEYTKWEEDGFLYIQTEKLKLQYRIGEFPGTFNPASSRNLKITFDMNGQEVTWYPWKKDPQNLKGTCRTLDGANGDNKRSELEDGLISRSGWAVIDETSTRGDGSTSLLFTPGTESETDWWKHRPDAQGMDWYFMGYGHDYKKALYDFTRISGKIPMLPLYAFGYWYSKYEKYTEADFMQLVKDMEDNDVPVDVMVIDMGWHKEYAPDGGWTGWSWDKDYFPNPKSFLDKLHAKNLKVTLNLHPADGIAPYEDGWSAMKSSLQGMGYDLEANSDSDGRIRWNLKDEKFAKALMSDIIRPLERDGVDFWWIDWQQNPFQIDGLSSTFWLNHVFYNDMAATYSDKRPMIFHRWGGLGNHRYQLGFSGDSHSNFETLAFEPYFTATAANVGYGYWGHDLGGHYQPGPNNPELFLRWIQFGAFSPILRTHSSADKSIERRIWKYENFEDMNAAFKLRYAMIPYIYTQSRKTYDTGISLCRPLYYDNPEVDAAYENEGEYMFGDDILVNPITKPAGADKMTVQSTWLPAGKWYDVCRGTLINGNRVYTDTYSQREIPYFFKAGAVIPNYPEMRNLKSRPDNLIILFAPGADGETSLYEDDGDSEGYKKGEYATTRITQSHSGNTAQYTIYPVEGTFKGQLTERSYTVKLLASNKPKTVTVNGKAAAWTFDSKTKTVVVDIAKTPCSQTVKIAVEEADVVEGFQPLYIVGSATSANWDNSRAPQLLKVEGSENLYSWTGEMNGGGEFKFICTRSDWRPCYVAESDGQQVELGKSYGLVYYPDYAENDFKFVIREDGTYTVTVDLENSKMTVGKGTITPPTVYNYYLSGSAIEGSRVRLEADVVGDIYSYRFDGALDAGEFRVECRDKNDNLLHYLVPAEEDIDIADSRLMKPSEAGASMWNVSVSHPHYIVQFNMANNSVSARTFQGLYLVGGATEAGWNAGSAIPFVRDAEIPYVYTITTELKRREENTEPDLFKILGQLDWSPYSLHPASPDEPILEAATFVEGQNDNKWSIDKDGIYRISVDLKHNTISGEYVGASGVAATESEASCSVRVRDGSIVVDSGEKVDSASVCNMQGQVLGFKSGIPPLVLCSDLQSGMYVVRVSTPRADTVKKVFIR